MHILWQKQEKSIQSIHAVREKLGQRAVKWQRWVIGMKDRDTSHCGWVTVLATKTEVFYLQEIINVCVFIVSCYQWWTGHDKRWICYYNATQRYRLVCWLPRHLCSRLWDGWHSISNDLFYRVATGSCLVLQCYTAAGLELTRVTVVDHAMNKTYDSLVRPELPIVDYNSR